MLELNFEIQLQLNISRFRVPVVSRIGWSFLQACADPPQRWFLADKTHAAAVAVVIVV